MQRETRVGVWKEEVRIWPPESIVKLGKDLRARRGGEDVLTRNRHGLECGAKARDRIWWAIARICRTKTLEGKYGRKRRHDEWWPALERDARMNGHESS